MDLDLNLHWKKGLQGTITKLQVHGTNDKWAVTGTFSVGAPL